MAWLMEFHRQHSPWSIPSLPELDETELVAQLTESVTRQCLHKDMCQLLRDVDRNSIHHALQWSQPILSKTNLQNSNQLQDLTLTATGFPKYHPLNVIMLQHPLKSTWKILSFHPYGRSHVGHAWSAPALAVLLVAPLQLLCLPSCCPELKYKIHVNTEGKLMARLTEFHQQHLPHA
jgi:hypothetical protein